MRWIGRSLTFLGIGILLMAAAARLSADYLPDNKCLAVDNTACTGQNRSICGVLIQNCIRCEPHIRSECQYVVNYDCLSQMPMGCPGKETGTCMPDPADPTKKTCQSWTPNGDCDATMSCM